MIDEFSKEIRKAYDNFLILTEADLQAHASVSIRKFFDRFNSATQKYKVFNQPQLKVQNIKMYPDIVVFKRRKPWIIVELKEVRELKQRARDKVVDRLEKAKTAFHVKRGYLVWVARYGNERVRAGRFFVELPITLEQFRLPDDIRSWELERDKWTKYSDSPLSKTERR